MTDIVRLKSRLLREGDPMQVDISQFKIPLGVNQEIYERDLDNFRRRFAVVEDAEKIILKDMVTLTCTGENPRFCKEHITIRAGLGLFSKEMENQLLGWKAGQSGIVTVKNQPVTVNVESIRREILPEVDDDLAARCGIPGIRTAEDIRAYCRGKQFDKVLEQPLDDAFPYLSREVIEASEFELDEEELNYSRNQMLQHFRRSPLFQEKDFDSISAEEFTEMFGTSKENMISQIKQGGAYSLKSALLGLAMLERAGKQPTEEDYAAYLRRFADVNGQTEEQARLEHPVIDYYLDQVCGYFEDELEALTLQRLKEGAV